MVMLRWGGQKGQVLIKKIDGSWMAQTTVSDTINNSIHLCNAGQDGDENLRVLISNNDQTVKIYSVPSMEHFATLKLNAAVNACTHNVSDCCH